MSSKVLAIVLSTILALPLTYALVYGLVMVVTYSQKAPATTAANSAYPRISPPAAVPAPTNRATPVAPVAPVALENNSIVGTWNCKGTITIYGSKGYYEMQTPAINDATGPWAKATQELFGTYKVEGNLLTAAAQLADIKFHPSDPDERQAANAMVNDMIRTNHARPMQDGSVVNVNYFGPVTTTMMAV